MPTSKNSWSALSTDTIFLNRRSCCALTREQMEYADLMTILEDARDVVILMLDVWSRV